MEYISKDLEGENVLDVGNSKLVQSYRESACRKMPEVVWWDEQGLGVCSGNRLFFQRFLSSFG